jgi:hypothetical protein
MVGIWGFVSTKGIYSSGSRRRGGSGVPSGTRVLFAAHPALETPGYCQVRLPRMR